MINSISEKLFLKYLFEEKQFLFALDKVFYSLRNEQGHLPDSLISIYTKMSHRIQDLIELTND